MADRWEARYGRYGRFERSNAAFRARTFQPRVARKAQREADLAMRRVLVDRHGEDRPDITSHLYAQAQTPPNGGWSDA